MLHCSFSTVQDGFTALHRAVSRGQTEICECLLNEAAIDVNVQNQVSRLHKYVALLQKEVKIIYECPLDVHQNST